MYGNFGQRDRQQKTEDLFVETDVDADEIVEAPPNSLVHTTRSSNGKLDLTLNTIQEGCPVAIPALIAVFSIVTDPTQNKHRHELRKRYRELNNRNMMDRNTATLRNRVDIVFFFGTPNDTEWRAVLEQERKEFPEDVVIVPRVEDRDSGKIMDWFQYTRNMSYTKHPTIPQKYCQKYMYIGKSDIDSVIHLPRLVTLIENLPTRIPNFVGRRSYTHMTGMLYLLSTSLVEWICFSSMAQGHVHGVEDTVVGKWIQHSDLNVNWADQGDTFHDLPDSPNWCPGLITNRTVVVHWCKDALHFEMCVEGLLDGKSLVDDVGHAFTETEGVINRARYLGLRLTQDQVAEIVVDIRSLASLRIPRRLSLQEVDDMLKKKYTPNKRPGRKRDILTSKRKLNKMKKV
ncbi:hypothetical protein BDR26DRAFT_939170 [Obelidium mucronatum]|nr:hypothetical protein BDR26DRAFT_939170 [Obelidium mucronatum]